MNSMDKTILFVLMLAFLSLQNTVNGACNNEHSDTNSTNSSAMEKVSVFFLDIGCSIKSGANRVRDKIESGFNYVKNKITPDENDLSVTETIAAVDDQIGEAERLVAPKTNTDKDAAPESMIQAPEMCPPGQVFVQGKCRIIDD